jgi:hypothetical protein
MFDNLRYSLAALTRVMFEGCTLIYDKGVELGKEAGRLLDQPVDRVMVRNVGIGGRSESVGAILCECHRYLQVWGEFSEVCLPSAGKQRLGGENEQAFSTFASALSKVNDLNRRFARARI